MGLPRADPEASVWVWLAYKAGDTKEHCVRVGGMQGERKATKVVLLSWLWEPGSLSPWGPLGDCSKYTPERPHGRLRRLWSSTNNSISGYPWLSWTRIPGTSSLPHAHWPECILRLRDAGSEAYMGTVGRRPSGGLRGLWGGNRRHLSLQQGPSSFASSTPVSPCRRC